MYEEKIIPPKKAMPQARDGYAAQVRAARAGGHLSVQRHHGLWQAHQVARVLDRPVDHQKRERRRDHRGLSVHPAADHHAGAAARGGHPGVCRCRRRAHAGTARGQPRHVRRDAGRDRCRAQRADGQRRRAARRRDDRHPVVVTVARADTDFDARLQSGTNIFNVSAAAETPAIVRSIRERYPDVPIIATGARRMRASSRPFRPAPTPSRGRRRPTVRSSATSWPPTATTSRTPDPVHRKTDPNKRSGRFFALHRSSSASSGKNCSACCTV